MATTVANSVRPLYINSTTSSFNQLHSFSSTQKTIFLKSSPFHLRLQISKSPPFIPTIKAQSSQDCTPEVKFYKIEAILRPWRVPQVSSGLLRIGIRGVTVSDVRGFGAQGGSTERHGGSEFSEDKFVSKVKMEVVVSSDQVDAVINKIVEVSRTGEIGDGKIFVIPVSDIIRVRTGERGAEAERMAGGRSDMVSASVN